MTSDPSLLREHIRALGISTAQGVQQLTAVALSLIAENMELRERQEVTLAEGESWPWTGDLPGEEYEDFRNWLKAKYPQMNDGYFPWDYSDWKASVVTQTGLAAPSEAPPGGQPQSCP